jgi:hypothetical protein
MVKSLSRRVTRIGDRVLERVVPKTTANAVCGGWVHCWCAWRGNQYMEWRKRVDPEHGGICESCQAKNLCV